MGRSTQLRPCAKYTRLKRGMNSVLTESKANELFFPEPSEGLIIKYFLLVICWSNMI